MLTESISGIEEISNFIFTESEIEITLKNVIQSFILVVLVLEIIKNVLVFKYLSSIF